MDVPIRASVGEGRTQLESVVCWPLVGGAAFTLGCLVALAALIEPGESPDLAYPPFTSAETSSSVEPHRAALISTRAAPVADCVRWDEESSSVSRIPRSDDEVSLNASLFAASLAVDLDSEPGDGLALWLVGGLHALDARQSRAGEPRASLSEPIEWLLQARQDLRGLPLVVGEACRTNSEQLTPLIDTSYRVRRLQGPTGRSTSAFEEAQLLDCLACLGQRNEAVGEPRLLVRPLEQMIQVETPAVRVGLIATLSKIEGQAATEALARRAVFDLNCQVRDAAIESLKKRDASEAREVFLTALRHPWAPVADHAALALAALGDDGAADRLRELMHRPDPSAPFKDTDGRWKRNELVRVNHLRNCLLCHPPSVSLTDKLTGPVPVPGDPLEEQYYGTPRRMLVRADVVFFRQDFSAMHAVEQPGKWPEVQRFDYLVRKRELQDFEAEMALAQAAKSKTHPQREAIRWALAQLTGKRTRR